MTNPKPMDEADATPIPQLSEAKENFWRKWSRRLWGYDYFISYHWASGGPYAVALAQRLLDRGYECFLDRVEYAMGEDWKVEGERALRHTQRLVLIATPEAVSQSMAVAREVEIFTARSNHIIPIVFGERFTSEERQQFETLKLIPDSKLEIVEQTASLEKGPSEDVVAQLVNTDRVLRRRTLRARVVAGVIAFLVVAAVGAGIAALVAVEQRKVAEEQTKEAKRNLTSSYLHLAKIAHNDGNIAEAVTRYFQAYKAAPKDDPRRRVALRLIGSWSRRLDRPLPHESAVDAVAFSSDGRTVLTGSTTGIVRIWDAKSGRILNTISSAKGERIYGFSRDARQFLSGNGNIVQLWDIKAGKSRSFPHDDGTQIRCAAFSPDMHTVATGTEDGIVRLWDVASRSLKDTLPKHPVVSAVFSADGKILLTAALDAGAYLWNIESGEREPKLFQTRDRVWAVAISPDNRFILTTGERAREKVVRLWDMETKEVRKNLPHDANVYAATFSPDGQTVLTGAADGKVLLWDVETGEFQGEVHDHEKYAFSSRTGYSQVHSFIEAVAFSPDGRTVLTGGGDFTARLSTIRIRASTSVAINGCSW